jgi:hypothetical protein
MSKRGDNAFRRTDAVRAVKAAHDAGVEPAVVEIVTSDGTTFRIFGVGAAPPEATAAGAKQWQEEIAKLKASRKGGKE